MDSAAHRSDNDGTPETGSGLIADLRKVSTLVSPLLGAGAGFWADSSGKVLGHESVVLLAVGGAAIGLLAVALAAMALVFVLLEGFFGPTIAKLGIRGFFRPFTIVAVLSGSAAVVSFAGAMDSESGSTDGRVVLFGVSAWLMIWAIAGVVELMMELVEYADLQDRDEKVRRGPDTTA